MYVQELWRYPVKSLRGEPLEEADVTADGIVGDRRVVIVHPSGRVITARTQPRLLALQGTFGADGTAYVNGMRWNDLAALDAVRNCSLPDVKLVAWNEPDRFDVLPLTVATDGTIDHLAIDRRRLRPNIVVGGVEGLGERGWPGKMLRIGDVQIKVARLRPRCVMTTYHPDTQVQDRDVLLRIVRELEGSAALDCSPATTGRIRVGDPVELVST